MLNLLVFREKLKDFYQKNQSFLIPGLKFVASLIIFMLINSKLGLDARLSKIPVLIVLSLLSAFTPINIMVLLAAAVTLMQVYTASPFLALMAAIILLIMYLLFIRFTPQYGWVILLIPVLFLLRIPYVVPILLGMIASPVSVIASTCGVVTYYMFYVLKQAMSTTTGVSMDDVLIMYTKVLNDLINNRTMMVSIIVFIAVTFSVYIIRTRSFDHSFDIAIAIGGVINILLYMIGIILFSASVSIVRLLIGTVFSVLIVFAVQFMRLSLNYASVERTQFEDDEYYYYVKAVPKIKVTSPEMNVKRFSNPRAHYNNQEEELLDEDFDVEEDQK